MLRKTLIYSVVLLLILLLVLVLLASTYHKPIDIPAHTLGWHIKVAGIKTRVYQIGEGPDILYLHGSLGNLEDFETVWPLLKDRYRVTTIDRVGMGYSDLPQQPINIETNAFFVKQLLEALNLTDVIIVGHSYGGSVALKLAIDNTPNIKGYVLIAPAPYALTSTRRIEHLIAQPHIGMGLLQILRPLFAEDTLRSGLDSAVSPNQQQMPADFFASRINLWNNPGTLYARAQQTRYVIDELNAMSKQYKELHAKMAIVLGEQEPFQDIRQGNKKFLSVVPSATSIVVKGAGHYPHYIQPQAVVTAIGLLQ